VSYQVLARKYRPANFEELAGQEHVLRALINSLETNRLHHAYLFTGTRGVGKTTIARILAKCLNCDAGVTATPCGTCGSCLEIAEGRSVDLIEVDAASRTRVEETRELLDNVQYMPTRSRFKIYLIDEVHMFSNHSFNALLKTLEEPPEHVKFLLATTDPKKLPITVLSRCLQFNLKNLSPERVVSYLQEILQKETIGYEEAALWHLGRAADGSMRDALSLTDQAISFGENQINEIDVKAMLGSIDRGEVYRLIDALIEHDGKQLLDRIEHLAEFSPDYGALLGEFLSVLHRVAVAQAVPEGIDNSQGDKDVVMAIAQHISPEDVQLYYQIGLLGQKDLPFAPDQRSGFEMTLLRMLSFIPNVPPGRIKSSGESDATSSAATAGAVSVANAKNVTNAQVSSPSPLASMLEKKREIPDVPVSSPIGSETDSTIPFNDNNNKVDDHKISDNDDDDDDDNDNEDARARPAESVTDGSLQREVKSPQRDVKSPQLEVKSPQQDKSPQPEVKSPEQPIDTSGLDSNHSADNTTALKLSDETGEELTQQRWLAIFPDLGLSGVTQTLAANCTIGDSDGDAGTCCLLLNQHHASMWNKTHEVRIAMALSTFLGHTVTVKIEIGESSHESPAEAAQRRADEALAKARVSIENDENVQELIQSFDGTLVQESIIAKAQDSS